MSHTGDALVNRAYALAMQYGGRSKDYKKFPALDAEWDLLSAALPRLLAGENERLQKVCKQLVIYLDYSGKWDERLWLCEKAEERALDAGDPESAGWRAFQAGWVYYHRNQPDKVLACAARAAEHWRDSIPRNRAIAIRLRGLGYELNKKYPDAIAAYSEALEIYRSISPESADVAIALNALAGAERACKNYAAAERNYREALRIAKKVSYQEGVPTYMGDLAALALDREQWTKAEALAREALALSEEVGRQVLIAHNCHRIAIALFKQGKDLREALSFSRRAVAIFTNLHSKDLQKAQDTLSLIEAALQNPKN